MLQTGTRKRERMAFAIEPRGACDQALGQTLEVGAEGPNRTRYGARQSIGSQRKLGLATLDHKRWIVEARAARGRIERVNQTSRIGVPGTTTALVEHFQIDLIRPDHRSHRGTQTLMARLEHVGQLRHSRRHRFCRCRWRGGATVAHHVANRGIGLMANAGHHGHGASRHRTGKLLVVKGHEVLEGAAATDKQNAIGRRRNGSGAAQAFNKLCRRALALDLCAHADKLDERVATELFGQLRHLLTQQALPRQRE